MPIKVGCFYRSTRMPARLKQQAYVGLEPRYTLDTAISSRYYVESGEYMVQEEFFVMASIVRSSLGYLVVINQEAINRKRVTVKHTRASST